MKNNEQRIIELEQALRSMLAQFWCNLDYDEDDAAVLITADKTLKGRNNE